MKKTLIILGVALLGFAAAVATSVKNAAVAMGERAHAALEGYMFSNGLALALTTKTDTFIGKLPVRTQPMSSDILEVALPFQMPDLAPGVNDIIAIGTIPAGVDLVDYVLVTDDMDSNGAPAIAFTLGSLNAALTALATTYAAAQTTMQNGGLLRAANAAHWLESNATPRPVGIQFTAAAATYSGTGKKAILILRLRG